MAPVRNSRDGIGMDRDDNHGGTKVDRKIRKPLVEKKRRARINESLQELRLLIADTDLQSKMENAEVLEMTVKRVESILQSRAQDIDTVNREACERFAAGYIQCMHEVHTFVSNCPGIDPTVAAELLNHLLESMPSNDEDRLQVMLSDILADHPSSNSTWPLSESMYTALVASPAGAGLSGSGSSGSPTRSPSPSLVSSTDDLCSDLDDTESDQSSISVDEDQEGITSPTLSYPKSMWRPW